MQNLPVGDNRENEEGRKRGEGKREKENGRERPDRVCDG